MLVADYFTGERVFFLKLFMSYIIATPPGYYKANIIWPGRHYCKKEPGISLFFQVIESLL